MNNFDFDFLETLGKHETNLKLIGVAFAIVAFAIYVGFLIYGNRGLNRVIELQQNKEILQKEVMRLKKENVKLQKEYFGLKDIEGEK